MSRQQQPTSGANDANAQSTGASSTNPSTTTTSTSMSGRPTTEGGTNAANASAGTAGTTGRDMQSSTRDTQRGGDRQSRSRSRGPALTRWSLPPSPWELLRRMSEDINRAAEELKGTRAGDASRSQRASSMVPTNASAASLGQLDATAWVPDVEVVRQPNDLVVLVDLPGIAPDEIDISIDDGLLTITGERTMEQRDEREGFVRTERAYGAFQRTVILPDGADESRIHAKIDKGVLEIDVPLAGDNGHSRHIPVTS
jgi:HSP20 family molecular chaperone IbpA